MASPAQIAANQLNRPEDTGREAHESDGSEFGARDRFGSGDGQGDRLERADVIERDGVEQHGDESGRMGEIGENPPSSRRTPPRSGASLQKAGRTTKSTKSTKLRQRSIARVISPGAFRILCELRALCG